MLLVHMEVIMNYDKDRPYLNMILQMQQDANQHMIVRIKRLESIVESLSDTIWKDDDDKSGLSILSGTSTGFKFKKR